MPASERTNAEWAAAIESKIMAIEADTSTDDYYQGLPSLSELAQLIDHTLLKPDSAEAQVDQLCNEAKEYAFKSCCVNGSHVKRAAENLKDSACVVACVIGFPLGAMDTSAKAFEAQVAISHGAQELDMVLLVGSLKSCNFAAVYNDISSVAYVCRLSSPPVILKTIIETALLTRAEIIAACFVAAEAGADFVKTCTGFSGGMATPEDVRLMRKTVAYREGKVKVKASAGIRDLQNLLALAKAGAERIGTSAGATIIQEAVRGNALSKAGDSGY